MAKKIAFMVMPFSTKKTGLSRNQGPKEVDFDALWEKALAPALTELGYQPVRADQDVGALIIVEMIQRLAYSDLVVADISIANANVYYEIGVRHAAKKDGCVMTSADWGKALFDVDQMPRLVYPLKDGKVGARAAKKIKDILVKHLPGLAEGDSPVFASVPDFEEGLTDEKRAARFAADVEAVNSVMARIHAVHAERDKSKKSQKALKLSAELEEEGELQDGVRLAIMQMLRDCADWDAMIDYIASMPKLLKRRAVVKEQLALAHGESSKGDPLEAIGALEQLIKESGPSSERWGLIGGRYKDLYDKAVAEGDQNGAAGYLSETISAYEQGMMCDLNEYYPVCNLPRLLRIRGEEGDFEQAHALTVVVAKACERAAALNPDDVWIPLTRLGLAFDAEDPVDAARVAQQVVRDFPAMWMQESTLNDLRKSLPLVRDPHRRRELQKVLADLESGLPEEKRLKLVPVPEVTDAPQADVEKVEAPAVSEVVEGAQYVERVGAPPLTGAATVSVAESATDGAGQTVRVGDKGVVVTIRIEAG